MRQPQHANAMESLIAYLAADLSRLAARLNDCPVPHGMNLLLTSIEELIDRLRRLLEDVT